MKKIISVLMAVLLLASLGSFAFADEGTGWDDSDEYVTIDLPQVGLVFHFPYDLLTGSQGHIDVEYGDELGYGAGAYYTEIGYMAMTEDEFNNLEEFDESRYAPMVGFACIRNGCDLSAFNDAGIFINWDNSWRMATTGDYTHYMIIGGTAQGDELPYGFTEPYSSEYFELVQTFVDLSYSNVEYGIPKNPFSEQSGKQVSFTTTDLNGNPVSSEELFAENEVTMLNFWATWCGYCVGELPELERINGELQSMGCGVVGVLTDGQDADDVEEAKQDVMDAGVTYPVILAPENINELFDLGNGLPITYFVDRSGTIVGVPVNGAQVDAYVKAVEDILAGNAAT